MFSAATDACWPQRRRLPAPCPSAGSASAAVAASPPAPAQGPHTDRLVNFHSSGRNQRLGVAKQASHPACNQCKLSSLHASQVPCAPMPLPCRQPIFCSRRMPTLSATGATISSGISPGIAARGGGAPVCVGRGGVGCGHRQWRTFVQQQQYRRNERDEKRSAASVALC